MLTSSCNTRQEYYVVFILFMLTTIDAQPNHVGGNKKTDSQTTCQSTSSCTDNKLFTDILNLHNEYRSKHYSKPLKLNETLCRNAQKWATKLANEKSFRHQTNNLYGENLYAISTSDLALVKAKNVFLGWYNEGKDYNYSREPSNMKAGHFTQVVWKDTQELGLGMATKFGRTVIVATYYPPGNYLGEYTKNVMKPK